MGLLEDIPEIQLRNFLNKTIWKLGSSQIDLIYAT